MAPFVHFFKTKNNYYMFDVNTNAIKKVSKEFVATFNKQDKLNMKSCSKKVRNEYNDLIAKGLMCNNQIKKIQYNMTSEDKSRLTRGMHLMILQVTQSCNLRCSYCIYTDNNGIGRFHNNISMSKETIKKSIDVLSEYSIDSEEINISFYGGEPMLNFELIKYGVNYAKDIFKDKTLTFNMTTNGTLFNDENLKFLEDNNFALLISIDGNKEIHDQNRKFKKNKKLSVFDLVLSNIKLIKKKYPKLFSSLQISTVIDQRKTIDEYFKYDEETRVLQDIPKIISTIDYTTAKNKIKSSYEFAEQYEYYKFLTYLDLLGKIEFNDLSLKLLSESNCIRILDGLDAFRSVNTTDYPTGNCLFGNHRLMVDVNGNFLPCERVAEIPENYIGNIYDGLNIKKIEELQNCVKANSERCKKCYAIHNCTLCLKQYDIFESDNKYFNDLCENVKRAFERELYSIATLNEIFNNQ